MGTKIELSQAFDIERIERETLVRRVVFRREMRSTNDHALLLAKHRDLPLPLLVLAERQTSGRGRGSNRWWSARGSLTFSLILGTRPAASAPPPFLETEQNIVPVNSMRPEHWPRVSLTAAVAVCEALEAIAGGIRCGIRWPNDVYVGERKVCGILPEPAPAAQGGADHLVVGIGINVNNTFDGAPVDVCTRAASLADLTGRSYELTDVLVALLKRLDHRLGPLSGSDMQLSDCWSARCVLRSRVVEVTLGARRVRGRCHGVARDGALLLSTGARVERLFGGVINAVTDE